MNIEDLLSPPDWRIRMKSTLWLTEAWPAAEARLKILIKHAYEGNQALRDVLLQRLQLIHAELNYRAFLGEKDLPRFSRETMMEIHSMSVIYNGHGREVRYGNVSSH